MTEGTTLSRQLGTSPLLAGFALIASVIAATLWLVELQNQATDSIEQTLEVDHKLSDVQRLLVDAESGQRGFLVTADRSFLVPYDRAVLGLDDKLAELRSEVSDDVGQMARLSRLTLAANARVEHLANVLASGPSASETRLKSMQFGQRLMADASREIEAMRAEEQRLLGLRHQQAAQLTALLIAVLLATVFGLMVLGRFTINRFNQQIAALAAGRDALDLSNRQLRGEAASRAEAENQTRQLQKMQAIGQLTGGIAHDFNNMLAIVIGSLDMAKRRLLQSDLDRAETSIDNAIDGAQRASQLTARLMAFARQQPLEPVTVDINLLVDGMSQLLRRTLGETVQVETRLVDDLWRCFVDPHQLESALVNLCVNARDAMPDGGKLTIATGNAEIDRGFAASHGPVSPGDYVLLSVSDQGVGMHPEVIERAFDPFFTTKGVGQGTGLGLSQVHGFITQSGGHVTITSQPGAGTKISLYLPRMRRDVALARQAPAITLETLPIARGEETILVVEDEDRVRDTTTTSLRELGYDVVQAADARQAMAVIEQRPKIDLLFTDVVMPGMNGGQLAHAVAALRPDIPILFTTGHGRNAITQNGMLAPGVTLLPKPFTISQLAQKIRQMLDHSA